MLALADGIEREDRGRRCGGCRVQRGKLDIHVMLLSLMLLVRALIALAPFCPISISAPIPVPVAMLFPLAALPS